MNTVEFSFGSNNLTVWVDMDRATDLAAQYEKGTGRYALVCRTAMNGPEETIRLDLSKVLWLLITSAG